MSLIGIGVKSGFQIIRYFFCKSLERGDYTNEQILSLFENKLVSISKDLETLKLQKLKSAAFLLKSGVQMYNASDIEEAYRNFDKAEMDAVEAFSTAPTVDWKVMAIQIAICSHIWRKAVLPTSFDAVNFVSVCQQVLLHIHRLLEDAGIKNTIKTFVSGSLMSNFNKTKRTELIFCVVELEQSSRRVLFENFLEILPLSYIHFDDENRISISRLFKKREEPVPYSPRQCSISKPIPIVKSWRNLICNISLERNATNVMVSCAQDHNEADVYIAQRQWIDIHTTVKKLVGSMQNFVISKEEIFEVLSKEKYEIVPDRNDFEIVFMNFKAFFSCPEKSSAKVFIYLNDKIQESRTYHRATVHQGGNNQEISSVFYRGHPMIKFLNENSSPEKLNIASVNLFAAQCDVDVKGIETIVHYKNSKMSLDGMKKLDCMMKENDCPTLKD